MFTSEKNHILCLLFVIFFLELFFIQPVAAQKKDTTSSKTNHLLHEMVRPFTRDTTQVDHLVILRRNDQKYRAYSGMIIRNIIIERYPFGAPFNDESKKLENTLTYLANKIHKLTKVQVIRKNLFFNQNDTLNPFLLADNERYLRELSFIRDADFKIIPVSESDSADVVVVIKDVFSLGGALNSLGLDVRSVEMREDNFRGSGNAGIIYMAYDVNRKKNLALGGELVRRNIDKTFISQRIGYQSYYNSFRAPKQEDYLYYNLNKPLLNRYMKFTYELDVSFHATKNRYNYSDSLYYTDYRYKYSQFEGWLGYNINGKHFSPAEESRKLRLLSGLRIFSRSFNNIPRKYEEKYNWQFASLGAVLASFTFYRQNFIKTQFVYGFGINEDIPEGMLFTFTTGHTIKEERSRPFIGLNFQKYNFVKNNRYLDYTLRSEGFLNKKRIEDINLLASINYFDRLKNISPRWRQRFFLSLSASRQVNPVLNEPLFINSQFGIPEYGRDLIGGNTRITAKAESVFFSPWSIAEFKFAPLLSYNFTAFSPVDEKLNLYSSLTAGVRTRNESLIFGTIELKANYFPRGNFVGEIFNFDISTNVSFKYRSQFLKKPDFIEVN